jgi:hypothetical protein
MALTRKDAAATALTALVALTFVATHAGWGVPLVGNSHRCAAGVILTLGLLTCGLGSPARGGAMTFFASLGTAALVFAGLALWTGSLTPLSLLAADLVGLWAVATSRHLGRARRTPITAA